jgi:hypothetical protein
LSFKFQSFAASDAATAAASSSTSNNTQHQYADGYRQIINMIHIASETEREAKLQKKKKIQKNEQHKYQMYT